MSDARPLPDLSDPVSRPYWEALREGRVSVQRCPRCSSLRFPPAKRCPACWLVGGDWIDVAAAGTVWSFAVYHRSLHPAFKAEVPYTVGLVDLDAGVRMAGRIVLDDGTEPVRIGDRVRGVFVEIAEGVTVLSWASERHALPAASTRPVDAAG